MGIRKYSDLFGYPTCINGYPKMGIQHLINGYPKLHINGYPKNIKLVSKHIIQNYLDTQKAYMGIQRYSDLFGYPKFINGYPKV